MNSWKIILWHLYDLFRFNLKLSIWTLLLSVLIIPIPCIWMSLFYFNSLKITDKLEHSISLKNFLEKGKEFFKYSFLFFGFIFMIICNLLICIPLATHYFKQWGIILSLLHMLISFALLSMTYWIPLYLNHNTSMISLRMSFLTFMKHPFWSFYSLIRTFLWVLFLSITGVGILLVPTVWATSTRIYGEKMLRSFQIPFDPVKLPPPFREILYPWTTS